MTDKVTYLASVRDDSRRTTPSELLDYVKQVTQDGSHPCDKMVIMTIDVGDGDQYEPEIFCSNITNPELLGLLSHATYLINQMMLEGED